MRPSSSRASTATSTAFVYRAVAQRSWLIRSLASAKPDRDRDAIDSGVDRSVDEPVFLPS
ncbi:hypothetical protein AKJ09_10327 [Labilithrix luteola]|uniref:Uncharacterized protein n=1 Tax=Labilithrix luteola TaxID=1391654 RepID=A0A0K1QD40_9BACT|nr:hypothetical protein AKJ09_10327 [Labilithrix luteola]